ncbi:hypothetical protein C8J57DRAFT_1214225 [Mycena rebaudengoi]|nr:hypothetical protein C8J57DRAFT_1214225 [Mycena rebaudengoi]
MTFPIGPLGGGNYLTVQNMKIQRIHGGKVRFRNQSEPEPNLNRTCVRRSGSAFGGDQARSNAERKVEPEVIISVTSTANQHHDTSMLSAHNLAQDVMCANPTPLGTILYIQ